MEKLTDLLRNQSLTAPDRTAYLYRKGKDWASLTWSEADERIDQIAAGLIASGVRPGDTLSILGRTCLEWTLCDLAILRAGCVSVGIYPTLTGEQAGYILEDSSSRWLFLEDEKQLEKLLPFLDRLPAFQTSVLWEPGRTLRDVLSLSALEEKGRQALEEDPACTRRAEEAVQSEDMALLIYTSGTTGPPKGTILTHENIMAQLKMLDVMGELDENDIMLFFLPLSHVGERIPGHFNRIYRGVPAVFVEDMTRVLEDIREIRPTVFGSVPRIFEKAYAKVLSETEKASHFSQRIFRWAERVGREASRRRRSGKSLPAGLRLQVALADRLVFRRIRDVFGGRVRFFISSAAPISVEIIEFFHAAGMLILEGYGQTEVSCFCTLNLPDDYRLGSVGKALPGVQIKTSEEGEILVKAATVCMGYLNQQDLTRETITADGWIHTGDMGRLDEEGFLWITGRQKEIIITSGGKNVTPSNIENLLISHPLIEQALVHGDRRKYLTALLGLDPENVRAWAAREGMAHESQEKLLSHPALLEEVQRIVDQVNTHLARYETVKKFAILPRLLEVEKGEVTPTMKIRRRIVEAGFKDLLDSLY